MVSESSMRMDGSWNSITLIPCTTCCSSTLSLFCIYDLFDNLSYLDTSFCSLTITDKFSFTCTFPSPLPRPSETILVEFDYCSFSLSLMLSLEMPLPLRDYMMWTSFYNVILLYIYVASTSAWSVYIKLFTECACTISYIGSCLSLDLNLQNKF